jgi:hypothetical protein
VRRARERFTICTRHHPQAMHVTLDYSLALIRLLLGPRVGSEACFCDITETTMPGETGIRAPRPTVACIQCCYSWIKTYSVDKGWNGPGSSSTTSHGERHNSATQGPGHWIRQACKRCLCRHLRCVVGSHTTALVLPRAKCAFSLKLWRSKLQVNSKAFYATFIMC